MGEFGKMLIRNWGGDIKSYEGKKSITNITNIDESEEDRKKRKSDLIKHMELSTAREYLHRLTTNIMYRKEIAEQINEELFVKSYNDIGYPLEVSNVMWLEYCDFINKYIKK